MPANLNNLKQFCKHEWDEIPPQGCDRRMKSYRTYCVSSAKSGSSSYWVIGRVLNFHTGLYEFLLFHITVCCSTFMVPFKKKNNFIFKCIFLKNKPVSLYSLYSQHTDLQLDLNVCTLLHHPVCSWLKCSFSVFLKRSLRRSLFVFYL